MKSLVIGICLICAVVVVAGVRAQAPSTPRHEFAPVTDAMLAKPDPGDWLMWRRTLDSWGYSPLDQINKSNVAQLKQVWSHEMGPGRAESTPLVHSGIMFIPNAGDFIQAVDARTGESIWEYKRQLPQGVGPAANRAIAIWGTTIIDASSDNMMYAIDARTGQLVWETPVFGPKVRASAGSGPLIANGKVFTGRQCLPDGGIDTCVITAHDAKTGKELWRTRTIPKPGEPGDDTWGNVPVEQRWHVGTWMVPSYDVETNRVIIGTSVTIPAPKYILGGNDKKHLYHNSTLALDADTGKIVWYYQHLVDHWDLDHPFERLLVDTAVAPDPREVTWINPKLRPGERRKVITGIPGKTGVVYTLDRQTGEFLWARPTVFQNVIQKIDGATGEVTVDPKQTFSAVGDERLICPGTNGGKNWPAGAYSPQTNTMYYPLQNMCMTAVSNTDQRDPTKVYGLTTKNVMTPGADKVGTVWAISAETGKMVWKYEQRSGMMPLVSTGGGLIFVGDAEGSFLALDEKTGKVLWQAKLPDSISGYPIAYAVDGKEYVAVSTGTSLVGNAAAQMTPEIKVDRKPRMYVFALP
ncbi:MAG TPA: PQQ-binding-like beta-propeller repeat protein [Vicinamibacterales bacterium]|jgi:alcohol dehydrogenase (cytochrome c)|nr:PQQ-binding-like beta-propeller repeat protein [Vicinamibacterales bacterium]